MFDARTYRVRRHTNEVVSVWTGDCLSRGENYIIRVEEESLQLHLGRQ